MARLVLLALFAAASVAGPANAPTQLTDGVPYSDAIPDGTTNGVGYYAFLATSFSSVNVFVTPLAGNPNLWVHVVSAADGASNPISPYATGGAAYWTYAVTSVAGVGAVVVSSNDTAVANSGGKCVPGGSCLIFVAVTGAYNRGAQFTVVASSTFATTLRQGVPQLIALTYNATAGGLMVANLVLPVPSGIGVRSSNGLQAAITLSPVGT